MNAGEPESPPGDLVGFVRMVGKRLVRRGWTVSVAESCTGGLVGKLLTDPAGASAYFRGGVIAYADDVKRSLLGVPTEALEAHGAVSEPVAQAMASGVRTALGADVGLSVTGIAGPGGATPTKPVGTVSIAGASSRGGLVRTLRLSGSRSDIRLASAQAVLRLLEQLLDQESEGPAGDVADEPPPAD